MKEKINSIGLNFGREHIAVNGNKYRVAKPGEDFWAWYKDGGKEAMKGSGFSVYKHEKHGFCVYDWTNKEPATEAEKVAYKAEAEAWERDRLAHAVQLLADWVDERGEVGADVSACETWEEFEEQAAEFFDNVEYFMSDYIAINIKPEFYFS